MEKQMNVPCVEIFTWQRNCYGYTISPNGKLEINPDEPQAVRWIFERYLAGDSPGKIASGLERQGVPSPTGKPT